MVKEHSLKFRVIDNRMRRRFLKLYPGDIAESGHVIIRLDNLKLYGSYYEPSQDDLDYDLLIYVPCTAYEEVWTTAEIYDNGRTVALHFTDRVFIHKLSDPQYEKYITYMTLKKLQS